MEAGEQVGLGAFSAWQSCAGREGKSSTLGSYGGIGWGGGGQGGGAMPVCHVQALAGGQWWGAIPPHTCLATAGRQGSGEGVGLNVFTARWSLLQKRDPPPWGFPLPPAMQIPPGAQSSSPFSSPICPLTGLTDMGLESG